MAVAMLLLLLLLLAVVVAVLAGQMVLVVQGVLIQQPLAQQDEVAVVATAVRQVHQFLRLAALLERALVLVAMGVLQRLPARLVALALLFIQAAVVAVLVMEQELP